MTDQPAVYGCGAHGTTFHPHRTMNGYNACVVLPDIFLLRPDILWGKQKDAVKHGTKPWPTCGPVAGEQCWKTLLLGNFCTLKNFNRLRFNVKLVSHSFSRASTLTLRCANDAVETAATLVSQQRTDAQSTSELWDPGASVLPGLNAVANVQLLSGSDAAAY